MAPPSKKKKTTTKEQSSSGFVRSENLDTSDDSDFEVSEKEIVTDAEGNLIFGLLKQSETDHFDKIQTEGVVCDLIWNPEFKNVTGKRTLSFYIKNENDTLKITVWDPFISVFLSNEVKYHDIVKLTNLSLKKTDIISQQYNKGTTKYTSTWTKLTEIQMIGQGNIDWMKIGDLKNICEYEYANFKGSVTNKIIHNALIEIELRQKSDSIIIKFVEKFKPETERIKIGTKLGLIGVKKGKPNFWYNEFSSMKFKD